MLTIGPVITQWVKENWNQSISEPGDHFVNYCKKEIAEDIKYLIDNGYEEKLFKAIENTAKAANVPIEK